MKHVIYSFLICCVILPLFTGCSSRKSIVNGLDEKEANEIVVFLSTKGIDAIKVPAAEVSGGGAQKMTLWDISVPNEQVREATYILNQSGLPRRRGKNLLTIFSDSGLVPSEMQEKIRYQAGLAEQIAGTIRKIDGVLDAEVQISFPEEDPLNPGKTKGDITSSVYVKHSGVLDDPNSQLLTKIKRLVAASITGLKYDNVTVIADRARFSDFPVGFQASSSDRKDFVSVWTVIVAKESLTRFQTIFFSYSIVVLALLLGFAWLIWRVYPLIESAGGIAALFSTTPLISTPKEELETEESEDSEEEQEDEEEEKSEDKESDKPPTDVT